MIELCSSSGTKVPHDACVRCVCGHFWYGPGYPGVEGEKTEKRKVVDVVPWHNIKGHLIDPVKWENRMQYQVEAEERKKKIIFEKELREKLKYHIALHHGRSRQVMLTR